MSSEATVSAMEMTTSGSNARASSTDSSTRFGASAITESAVRALRCAAVCRQLVRPMSEAAACGILSDATQAPVDEPKRCYQNTSKTDAREAEHGDAEAQVLSLRHDVNADRHCSTRKSAR